MSLPNVDLLPNTVSVKLELKAAGQARRWSLNNITAKKPSCQGHKYS